MVNWLIRRASQLQRYVAPAQRLRADFAAFEFIVATKAGLFLTSPRSWHRLTGGTWYGLTRYRDTILAYEQLDRWRTGRLMQISATGVCRFPILRLPYGCHQIDVWRDELYIMDTYNNAVLRYGCTDWRLRAVYHPLGVLDRSRESANYGHLNSILFREKDVVIVAHNETTKTNRRSELIFCGHDFRLHERTSLDAGNAHNVAPQGSDLLICDSNGGRVISAGGRTQASLPLFTRGLSLTPDVIAVGESNVGAREDRESLGGAISYFYPDWTMIARQTMPAMVQDIRALRGPDTSLSEPGS
jgi:hypothetical protein